MSGHNDVIISTMEKKLKACDDFLASTLKLKEALEKNAPKTVSELIRRRSRIIVSIDELDRRIARYAASPPVEKSSPGIREIVKKADEISEKLKQVVIVNQQCETIAEGRRKELGNELAALKLEAEGLRGYAQRGDKTAKFLNIRT